MDKNIKISERQFFVLVLLFTVGTVILHTPSPLAAIAKQDAWLSAVIGTLAGLIIVWFYARVGNLFPSLTLDQAYEKVFGKWAGKLINSAFAFWALTSAAEILFYVGNFFRTYWMPATPLAALNILFCIIVVMAVRLGLETFSRAMEILFIPFLLLITIFMLSIFPQVSIHNIQPVLENGMKPVFRASLFYISVASIPNIVFLMVFPSFVNHHKAAIKSFFIGNLLGNIILICVILLNILVLGHDMTSRNLAPSYELAKKINIGDFFTRIEAIIALLWIITSYIRAIMYFYVCVMITSNIFEIKSSRPIILPLGFLITVLSMIIFPNAQHVSIYNKEIWLYYVSTFGILVPFILLCTAKVRKLK